MSEKPHGNWKGGRIMTAHGYIRLNVGKGHHLADSKGYAYEHRVVAEEKLGRHLFPEEIVHHINGDRADNRPGNLDVTASIWHHRALHRNPDTCLRVPGEHNPIVICKCGCQQEFQKYDVAGRPRYYVSGHNPIPAPLQQTILNYLTVYGVKHRKSIADYCSTTVGSVACALTRLRMSGLVEPVGSGVWRQCYE